MESESIARTLISSYRKFQYALYNRPRYGIMQPGVRVQAEPFRYDINQGDIVHPCIRYIPEAYLGHHWWMVYTPYYKSDASLENPVLCYAEGGTPNTPPSKWKHYCLVNEKPEEGYNSDPSLLYHEGVLYVFWRENYEQGTKPFYRATFAAKVEEGGLERIEEPLLRTDDPEIDAETCPCFMHDREGKVMAYGMHLRFHSPRIKKMRPTMKKLVNKIVTLTDLLGSYSQQIHYGLAIWQQDAEGWLKPYLHIETIRFKNCNKLYRPWHMDFFDWQNRRYCVVQTNQCNADVALAVSEDYKNFTFLKKPLMTNDTIGKLGIYKPCAGITPDGTFYLYYTAQDKGNRALNKLYLTTMSFDELLAKQK